MLSIPIPGRSTLQLQHVVLDYNGTIALDGELIPGVEDRLARLAAAVTIHILTADTHGTVRAKCGHLNAQIQTFPQEGAALCKARIVQELVGGACCIGNGYNDQEMLREAKLAIGILGPEGMFPGLLAHMDVVVTSPLDALDLLLYPQRLRATLRS